MIGLITLVENDYLLTLFDVVIVVFSLFVIKVKRNDFIAFFFGLFMITIFEYIFISTGVETFIRHSLFGLMPLWLPILWAYGFVAIKRSLEILQN